MWPYWLIFSVPAAFALLRFDTARSYVTVQGTAHRTARYWIAGIVLAIFVGFRDEVGGDWFSYIFSVRFAEFASFDELFGQKDPGYQMLNWMSTRAGWGIYGVNFFSAALFATCLMVFCAAQPRPWLGLVTAIPYMVVVVAMGYTRQSIALGFALLAFLALERRSRLWFVIWILIGTTFHKSAIILLPISVLAEARSRLWAALWIGIVTVITYQLMVEDSIESLYAGYIEREYESQGALVRLMMNVLPAGLLLIKWRRFQEIYPAAAIWRWMAVLAFVMVAALLISPSSTAVDRLALYVLPLQIVLFTRLPELFKGAFSEQLCIALVVSYYTTVHFVWLNFAGHRDAWLPYQIYTDWI